MAISRYAALTLTWCWLPLLTLVSSSSSSAGLGRRGITFVSAFVSNNNNNNSHNVNTVNDRKWKKKKKATTTTPPSLSSLVMKNFIGDLWEELIEFSTYGPAERKLLKERRQLKQEQQQKQPQKQQKGKASDQNLDEDYSSSISLESFQAVVKKRSTEGRSADDATATDNVEFATATATVNDCGDDEEINFDGYQLRDLLLSKWGIPLDIDFQRGYQGDSVYCTVVPVAYGSKKCRHVTELDYLMHLQGVVEILYKYDNLIPFIHFIETTTRQPKPNTDSVPFRLSLSPSQLERILNTKRSSQS